MSISEHPEPCGTHAIPVDDPFAEFQEAATRLKLVADLFACIESREQLEMLRDLASRQIAEARNALQIAVGAIEALDQC